MSAPKPATALPDQQLLAFVRGSLSAFGATLSDDGEIVRGDKRLGVRAVLKEGRLRFESLAGGLLASGRPDAGFVRHFVTRFWFWKEVA